MHQQNPIPLSSLFVSSFKKPLIDEANHQTFDQQRYDGRALTEEAASALSRELLPLYVRAFLHSERAVAERGEEFLSDLCQHLRGAERITTGSVGPYRSLLCGRSISTPQGVVFHLGGVLVDPALQGLGIGRRMLGEELLATKADILTFHTQSRVMLALGERFSEIDEVLAQQIAPLLQHRKLCGGVDEGRYGGQPLYGDPSGLRELAIPGLAVHRGDAIFVAGRVRKGLTEERE